MKYCQECGKQMKKSADICMNCGESNESNYLAENFKERLNDTIEKTKEYSEKAAEKTKEYSEKAVEKSKEIQESEKFKQTTKKAKGTVNIIGKKINSIIEKVKKVDRKILGCIAALIMIISVGLFIYTRPESAESIVNKFETAIIAEDLGKLKSLVKSKDKRLEVTETNLKGIIEHYKANPSNLNTDIDYLVNYSLDYKYADYPIQLVKEKKLLKEKYYIALEPRYIKLDSYNDNIKIDLVNGDDIIQEDLKEGEIGPFMPGEYQFVVTGTHEFSNYKYIQDVDLFYGDVVNYLDINAEIYENNIVSEYSDAIIYIDGKSTEKTASQLGEITALKYGTKIYGVIKHDGKEIKSNQETVSGSGEINLEFDYILPPTEQVAKEGISEIIGEYLENFAYAVNNGDISYIEDYIEYDSSLYNEQKKNVPATYDRGIREYYVEHKIIDIQYNEETKKGTLKVKEVYEIEKEDSLNEKEFENEYTFIYDEKDQSYKLTSLVIKNI